jgi:uncharacterized membrane protein
MAESRSNQSSDFTSGQRALIGAGLAVAAGAATFFFTRNADKRDDGRDISDAPDYVFRGEPELVGRTVTINRDRKELYDEWRDFTRFHRFMHNVREVVKLDDERSLWTIEAPLGSTVELVTRITADQPGRLIAWESEPESSIHTTGQVEFLDGPPGRGTVVRLTMTYTPPGGVIGKGIAKLLQKEPDIQARRDLRRFKQLMETGEITVNASPSGRKAESPTEARV